MPTDARQLFIALAACCAACVDQSPITPTANTLIVHAVLDASTRDQYVIVQTTTGASNQQKEVTGARVTITTPDARSVVAEEVRDSTLFENHGFEPRVKTVYRLTFDPQNGPLVGGGTYALHVRAPDGREVDGTTTLPAVANASTAGPSRDLDRLHDTLNLAWPSVRGTSAYEVFIGSSRSTFSLFADTTVSIPGLAENGNGQFAFWPGLTHQVIVSAVDANYYDYYRNTTDFFTGRGIINHLRGGIGVFGSVVPIASYTVVVR